VTDDEHRRGALLGLRVAELGSCDNGEATTSVPGVGTHRTEV
jgi:hypothetical protein